VEGGGGELRRAAWGAVTSLRGGLTFDARSGRAHVWLSARRTSALRTSENVPSPFFEMKRYSENRERGGERGGEGRVMAVSRFETCEELLDSAAREWGAGGKQPRGARAVAITAECSNANERCGFGVGLPTYYAFFWRHTPAIVCNSVLPTNSNL
jgi:hypothetical protein